MHPRTATMLQRIELAEWFTCLGVNDTTKSIVVSSWEEAVKYRASDEGQAMHLEATNHYCGRLHNRSKERFNKWNDVVDEMREIAFPVAKRKTEALLSKYRIPQEFEVSFRWDIHGACMETEFADVYPPGFFANLIYWYMRGHFPCGCQGVTKKVAFSDGYRLECPDLYPPGFYDPIANWYETGDFGNWQGQLPQGKLIVY